jgi:hypothetical protein
VATAFQKDGFGNGRGRRSKVSAARRESAAERAGSPSARLACPRRKSASPDGPAAPGVAEKLTVNGTLGTTCGTSLLSRVIVNSTAPARGLMYIAAVVIFRNCNIGAGCRRIAAKTFR